MDHIFTCTFQFSAVFYLIEYGTCCRETRKNSVQLDMQISGLCKFPRSCKRAHLSGIVGTRQTRVDCENCSYTQDFVRIKQK